MASCLTAIEHNCRVLPACITEFWRCPTASGIDLLDCEQVSYTRVSGWNAVAEHLNRASTTFGYAYWHSYPLSPYDLRLVFTSPSKPESPIDDQDM